VAGSRAALRDDIRNRDGSKMRMVHNHSTAPVDLQRLRDEQLLLRNTVADGGHNRLFETVAAAFPWSA
jgi:hypothetical protein